MIFIGHPGQGPTVLIVPTRPPSGDLEVIDQTSVRVYVALAGEIIVCLDVKVRTGAETVFSGVFGELDGRGRVGELVALAVAPSGLSASVFSGEGLESERRIGEPLDELATSGEDFDDPARVVEVDFPAMIGGLSEPAQAIELSSIVRGGAVLEAALAVCE